MREKIGEILGVIFEHKWIYYTLMSVIVCICVLLQVISLSRYGKQLNMIIPSHYQLESIICDILNMIVILTGVQIIILHREYVK